MKTGSSLTRVDQTLRYSSRQRHRVVGERQISMHLFSLPATHEILRFVHLELPRFVCVSCINDSSYKQLIVNQLEVYPHTRLKALRGHT